MKSSRLGSSILALLLCLIGDACEIRAADAVYYAIEMNGRVLGYSRFTVEKPAADATAADWRLESETTLKVALLGTAKTIVRSAETVVHADSGLPIRYRLTQKVNDAATNIECTFAADQARCWAYAANAEKGEPQLVPLSGKTWILGSNDFSHGWLLLRAAADMIDTAKDSTGQAELKVFLPDGNEVQSFTLVRGQPSEIAVHGKTRASTVWHLAGSTIRLYVAPDADRTLLRMDVPDQQTTITLAGPEVVQAVDAAGGPEVLAEHFVQSNVAFDDMLQVRRLRARLDVRVIGSGVENDTAVLNTARQKFEGQKQADRIQGTVVVESRRYAGDGAPPFPGSGEPDASLAAWLAPSAMIESDDPAIAQQAGTLTEGAADRWQAVQRIAQWVSREIRDKIADTPSARRTDTGRRGLEADQHVGCDGAGRHRARYDHPARAAHVVADPVRTPG